VPVENPIEVEKERKKNLKEEQCQALWEKLAKEATALEEKDIIVNGG
jgi:hypothetical protein